MVTTYGRRFVGRLLLQVGLASIQTRVVAVAQCSSIIIVCCWLLLLVLFSTAAVFLVSFVVGQHPFRPHADR